MKIRVVSSMKYMKDLLERNGIHTTPEHIRYDSYINECINREGFYRVEITKNHNGSFIFTLFSIERILKSLLEMQITNPKELSKRETYKLKRINYTIGDFNIKTKRETGSDGHTSVTETVVLPVKLEYFFK